MKTPDITPAQIVALLTFAVSQAVAFGVIDSDTSKLLLSIGGTVIAAGFKIADAIIRGNRAKVAATAIAAGQPLER